MVECLQGLEGVTVFVDDIAVWGGSRKEHHERLQKVLKMCIEEGINLNRKKCKFAVQEAKYLGHVLSKEGVKVDEDQVRAVKEMQKPQNKEEVHRFLGMINYLAKFIPNCSAKTEPLRKLLKKEVIFEWSTEQEVAYQKILTDLSHPPVLALFDHKKDVTLSVDASQHGLGACLLQDDQQVAFASYSLTPTQKHYAQIEKEMLAIVTGCKRFQQFIWGRKCIVETDHKPLEAIFRKPFSDISPRLLRMLMKLQNFDITIQYRPGKELVIADHLSRSHLRKPYEKIERSLEQQVLQVKHMLPLPEETWRKYVEATQKDQELLEVTELIQKGWPSRRSDLKPYLVPYWNIKDELYNNEGLVFRKNQIVVPKALRKQLLQNMHLDHSGLTRTLYKARSAIYWPGITNDIQNVVENCHPCQINAKANPKEPLIISSLPDYPFQQIAMDYFEEIGQKFLVIVDRYSHWFNIYPVNSTDSTSLINVLRSHFTEHGTPEEIFSDNGPPFTSLSFKEFCKQREIRHVSSSPTYAQSNGLAERAVQTAKRLILKCHQSGTALDLALMEHRNTPFTGNMPSPSELAIGRKLRTPFPHKKTELMVRSQDQMVLKSNSKNTRKHRKHILTVELVS
jgi:hypothetical protein